MEKLLLHPSIETAVKKLLDNPTQVLLLVGPGGAGKLTLAQYISSELLGIFPLERAAYYTEIRAEDGTIGIDQARLLTRLLGLKTTGNQKIRRIVVIEDANLLTVEAQNALLKTLEEVPADTVIIMTTTHLRLLLPTIRSRVQPLQLVSPSEDQALGYFKNLGFSEAQITQTHKLSDGQPALMAALLNPDTPHDLALHIKRAKTFFSQTKHERLASIDEYTKQKGLAAQFLHACKLVCRAALISALNADSEKRSTYWHTALSEILTAETKLSHNPNLKLLFTDLSIRL